MAFATPDDTISARVLALLGSRPQAWLAEGMGTTQATVSRLIKAGPTRMAWTADYIDRAARALGVTMADLVPGSTTLSDAETAAVLVLRTQGYKGLAALALAHLQNPR